MVNIPCPDGTSDRIIGFRIPEGDPILGDYGLSEPLAWLRRVTVNRHTAPPPSAPVGLDGVIEWLRKSAAACGTTEYGEGCRDAMNETADKLAALAQQPAAVDEAAAIRAFEEHFEASSDDPYFEGELELWLTAWRKALATQHQEPTT
jgi:hypothetical protein